MQEPVREILVRRHTMAWLPAAGRFETLNDEIIRRIPIG
jgi:hypothetical protein